jgi:hypothetical protein
MNILRNFRLAHLRLGTGPNEMFRARAHNAPGGRCRASMLKGRLVVDDELCPDGAMAETIAHAFHLSYIQLSAMHGWKVQEGTDQGWDKLPESNRQLMVDTVAHLLHQGLIHYGYGCTHFDRAES